MPDSSLINPRAKVDGKFAPVQGMVRGPFEEATGINSNLGGSV
jgi:hypothetical protein